jgi:hypothetical protein
LVAQQHQLKETKRQSVKPNFIEVHEIQLAIRYVFWHNLRVIRSFLVVDRPDQPMWVINNQRCVQLLFEYPVNPISSIYFMK